MDGILDNLLEESLCRVLCFVSEHMLKNFAPFRRYSSPSRWCQTSPVTLLHVSRPALDRSSLHRAEPNLIGSSARQAEQEFDTTKDKSSPTPSPLGAPTSPLGQFINPASAVSQVMTSIDMAALLLLQADVHHAELLQHLG